MSPRIPCIECHRPLVETAFYPNMIARGHFKCRDCFRRVVREGKGSEGSGKRLVRGTVCPICETWEHRLAVHMRKWHGQVSISAVRLEDECPEMHELLRLRSPYDETGSWPKATPCVYVVRAGGSGRPMKVGFTSDVKRRLVDLQVHCPDPICVLLTTQATQEVEFQLHAALRPWYLHGEWFQSVPDALRVLTTALTPAP